MLCSHTKRFIYLKTTKTAGTSVEVFFERFCCDAETYREAHHRGELVTPAGVIGYRGTDRRDSTFYNHMPAKLVRELLGEEVWARYFKFCVIRNPFDKVVSMFWMTLSDQDRAHLALVPFEVARSRFIEFCEHGRSIPGDRRVFMIDGEVAVDHFIRFEHLQDDVADVCRRLAIEPASAALGSYKSHMRARKEHFAEYYDGPSAEVVRKTFAWEIERFGYQLE